MTRGLTLALAVRMSAKVGAGSVWRWLLGLSGGAGAVLLVVPALAVGAPVASPAGTQTGWVIQSTPSPSAADSRLAGLSCTATTACTAVGSYHPESTGNSVTLAERWNGTSWAIQPTPDPSGAQITYLNGVACSSASACTAVGYWYNSAAVATDVIEGWNGTSWTIQSTPHPPGAKLSFLEGISCSSASACTAVGYIYSGHTDVTLAERWNGTQWEVQPTPNPAGAEASELESVSCGTASTCTAVGEYENSTGTHETLVERWNGTSWAIQSSPNPSGSVLTELNGVSCASATACSAVGFSQSSPDGDTSLAEGWNGTSWTIQPVPPPSGPPYTSSLSDVWCVTAARCTAVGNYETSAGIGKTLAERWNGTGWTTQPTPNPSSAPRESLLNGVTCLSATWCTAVGEYYTNAGDVEKTLAERWELP